MHDTPIRGNRVGLHYSRFWRKSKTGIYTDQLLRSAEKSQTSSFRRRIREDGLRQRLAEPAGEVLDELPRDATGARTAGDRPLVGLGAQAVDRQGQPIVAGEGFLPSGGRVLGAGVVDEPQAADVRARGHVLYPPLPA